MKNNFLSKLALRMAVMIAVVINVQAQNFISASTRWVDPNGNNSTAVAGDRNHPWQTPDAAASGAPAGTAIVVQAGVYALTNIVVVPTNGAVWLQVGSYISNYVVLGNSTGDGAAFMPTDNSTLTVGNQ